MRRLFHLVTACLLTLAACGEDDGDNRPGAVVMNENALGYYCQMNLTEHGGPKAQMHLDGIPQPIFFAQVRDAIAYQRMPEQSHAIAALYVSDMAVALSWESPGVANWIIADEAYFVVGSDATGGMGAAEAVPFSDRHAADSFAARHGGRVTKLDAITDAEILTPIADGTKPAEEHDYLDRLQALSKERRGES